MRRSKYIPMFRFIRLFSRLGLHLRLVYDLVLILVLTPQLSLHGHLAL